MARFFRIAVSGCLLLFPLAISAAQPCDTVVGRLASMEGQIEVQATGASAWQAASLNQSLCQGDTVRAAARSRATVALINQAVLRIDQNTAMRLDNISGVAEERSVLSLLKGAFQSFSRKPRSFEVSTPYLNGSIEGTEFVFRVEDDESILTVFEGIVLASNAQGSALVAGGEAVAAKAGQAPQARTVVRPRDAAQWSLYYPPILATGGGQGISPALRQAADDLSVGRVSEARSGVEQAIVAGGADAGLAYALRAVINVVQNEREAALADASQGVSLSPDSAAAKIALSYAQQANFQIAAARDTLQAAVAQQPQDALAHARLAELQLMLGERKAASASAQRAVELAPDLARTQLVLGFAALAEFDIITAKTAFQEAITQDSADPLPHLGLGLAKIRIGELAAGRQEIETAVALDSNDALLRSYLGKAYFEEKRSPLDSDQLTIAKELDPYDPTAFLYDGIRKQTENDPVGALKDLKRSAELNDNRAVYRSQLLLDKDRASRGTSLARAYSDLGFSRLGIIESAYSLTLDPANTSAHRFLSDTYRNVRRREIARVSELLQAQMLQDININPVQPSISSTNLNIISQGGPANAGFNEFTSLFERSQTKLDTSVAVGNNDTNTGEAVVSGLYNRFSISAGAYHHETDGFRENNHLRHDILNLYAQVALSPRINLQAEYSSRETESGDLGLNFDPDDYDASFDRDFDNEILRLGARFSPNPRSNLLVSYIRGDREDEQEFNKETLETLAPSTVLNPFPPPPILPGPLIPATVTTGTDFDVEEDSQQFEAAYLFNNGNFNITGGASYAKVEQEYRQVNIIDWSPEEVFFPDVFNEFLDEPELKDKRAYLYGNFSVPAEVNWTLGLSYQDYEEDAFSADRVNPKIGAQWAVSDYLQLRGAYFKVIKPPLAGNRTLEPTQVAGFNQLFDDSNGTKSELYGVALDWQASQNVFVGAELSKRNIETPEFQFVSFTQRDADFKEWDEQDHRLYVYWTPSKHWSLSAEAVYSDWKGDATTINPNKPLEVETTSLPIKAQYFHPSGFFAGLGVTYVDQEVERMTTAGDSDFVTADLAMGLRLPKRQGIVSLSVQNLFDDNFEYQDDSFRTFEDEPSIGPYIPERQIMVNITLNF